MAWIKCVIVENLKGEKTTLKTEYSIIPGECRESPEVVHTWVLPAWVVLYKLDSWDWGAVDSSWRIPCDPSAQTCWAGGLLLLREVQSRMIIMEAGFGLRPYNSNKVENLERDQRKQHKRWIKGWKTEYYDTLKWRRLKDIRGDAYLKGYPRKNVY